jgi:hypothetical protein
MHGEHAVALLSLAGFGLYTLLGLGSAQLAVALAALAGTIAIIASSILMSNRIPGSRTASRCRPPAASGCGGGRDDQRLRRGGDRLRIRGSVIACRLAAVTTSASSALAWV